MKKDLRNKLAAQCMIIGDNLVKFSDFILESAERKSTWVAPTVYSRAESLGWGTCGVIWALQNLAAITSNTKFEIAASHLIEETTNSYRKRNNHNYGLYNGYGGIMMVLLQRHRQKRNDKYLQLARNIALDSTETFLHSKYTPNNLLQGRGGMLLAIAHLYAVTEDKKVLVFLHQYIDKILSECVYLDSEITWTEGASPMDHSLGLGRSGVAMVFFALSKYFRDRELKRISRLAIGGAGPHQQNHFDWFTGGIGEAYARKLILNENSKGFGLRDINAYNTNAEQRLNGKYGNALGYVEWAKITSYGSYLRQRDTLAELALTDEPNEVGNGPDTGLFGGLSGALQFHLQILRPTVPNVLSLLLPVTKRSPGPLGYQKSRSAQMLQARFFTNTHTHIANISGAIRAIGVIDNLMQSRKPVFSDFQKYDLELLKLNHIEYWTFRRKIRSNLLSARHREPRLTSDSHLKGLFQVNPHLTLHVSQMAMVNYKKLERGTEPIQLERDFYGVHLIGFQGDVTPFSKEVNLLYIVIKPFKDPTSVKTAVDDIVSMLLRQHADTMNQLAIMCEMQAHENMQAVLSGIIKNITLEFINLGYLTPAR